MEAQTVEGGGAFRSESPKLRQTETRNLLAVCFEAGPANGDDCQKFMAQVPVLEAWMDAAAVEPEPFIVLFGRRAASLRITINRIIAR